MGVQVAVAGASGYAGGELLRLLLGHPEVELGTLTAGGHAGRPVTDAHPQLPALAAREFTPTSGAALEPADVVFLALPHGESATLAAGLPASAVVVDLGGDHRLADPTAWSAWYGGGNQAGGNQAGNETGGSGTDAASGFPGAWSYGLPELPGQRAALAGARRVANPGCYPTAVGLGLAPLLAAGLVEPADVVVVAASGTSGAGRAAAAHLLGSEVMGSMSAYKAGGRHQHTPEMEQALGAAAGARVTVSFTPTLAPMPRGILAACTARLSAGTTEAALRGALHAAYDLEPFVHLLAPGRWPATASTAGSNSAQLQVAADISAGRAVVVVAIDNLGKGAAGQAVQNANLALGLPETTGLSASGVAP